MAVVSVNILHNGWGASEDVGKKTSFTVVYLVEVDDKNDGAMVVMSADDGTTRIPRKGEYYDVGNDRDPFAYVKSKSPAPIDDKLWNVSVTFGPIDSEDSKPSEGSEVSGLDDELQPTDDPVEERVNCSISTVNATRAAERGAYIGRVVNTIGGNPWDAGNFDPEGFRPGKPPVSLSATPDGFGRIKNGVPITNSVFTPFDPPPEISYNQYRITCGMNVAGYPNSLITKVNSINLTAVTFRGPGLNFTAQPFTARYIGISAAERIKEGKVFNRLELEFLIDPLFGWRIDILDRGYCVNSNKTVSEGAPTKNNIVDEKGNQIAEPILLDGAGEMLDLEALQAVYLRYAVYPEIDFRQGNLTDFDKLHKGLN